MNHKWVKGISREFINKLPTKSVLGEPVIYTKQKDEYNVNFVLMQCGANNMRIYKASLEICSRLLNDMNKNDNC